MTIRDLNRQGKLFSQGHQPVVRVDRPGKSRGKWHRGCVSVEHDTIDGGGVNGDEKEFQITMTYAFDPKHTADTSVFFAFCYPHSYDDCQHMLEGYDAVFGVGTVRDNDAAAAAVEATRSAGSDATTVAISPSDDAIYYHRELLIRSMDGLRVDVITISSRLGILAAREPRLEGLFPDGGTPRAHSFKDKKVFFLSARVHPGETPASHLFNGLLKFLLNTTDPRAAALRRHYVFVMIPMLNPDGVKRGHYRADPRGVNLNRFYHCPRPDVHPSIFASRSLVVDFAEKDALKFYVDLHAHAAKRGCFVYGNALDGARQVENVLYPRLIALNSAYFDFEGSSFSEKNMFSQSSKDGTSKEGSGRVGTFLATNITHCYTLEANYNTGRLVNSLPFASGDDGCAEKPPIAAQPPPFTEEILEDVGRALGLAALDIIERQPWSRIQNSEYGSLTELRKHIAECIRLSRVRKGTDPSTMPRRVAVALRNQDAAAKAKAARLAREAARSPGSGPGGYVAVGCPNTNSKNRGIQTHRPSTASKRQGGTGTVTVNRSTAQGSQVNRPGSASRRAGVTGTAPTKRTGGRCALTSPSCAMIKQDKKTDDTEVTASTSGAANKAIVNPIVGATVMRVAAVVADHLTVSPTPQSTDILARDTETQRMRTLPETFGSARNGPAWVSTSGPGSAPSSTRSGPRLLLGRMAQTATRLATDYRVSPQGLGQSSSIETALVKPAVVTIEMPGVCGRMGTALTANTRIPRPSSGSASLRRTMARA